MRFLVDVVREGPTQLWWESKRIEFRKPRVYNPEKPTANDYKFVQAKCDGNRVLALRSFDTQKLHVITTQGIDIGEKLEQCHWAHQLWKKTNDLEWFDGEIYLPGLGREAVSTALAQRSKDIRFAAFGYSHTPSETSMEGVAQIIKGKNCGIDFPAWSRIGETTDGLLKTFRERADLAIDNVKAIGAHFDGVVFKNGMYSEWAKQKHQRTIDLIVMGLKPGKGKFAGMVGSLECAVVIPGTDTAMVVASCSGMDDAVRQAIDTDDVGRVVEVEYERVGTRGKLQHPRFVAWRDDKKPEQCTPDQDPALEQHIDA